MNDPLSGEETATHSRKISRFGKLINLRQDIQFSYRDSREETTRPRLLSPPDQTLQEVSVTSPTGGEMFLVSKMRQQVSPREYAQTAKFKRRNRTKRYDRGYLPDLYAIESADRNQNTGLPTGLEYNQGVNFTTHSAINRSIDTENSNERTLSSKRKSEQIPGPKKQVVNKAIQIKENCKTFKNKIFNQRIKQSVKRRKSSLVKPQDDQILKSLESNENMYSDINSIEEVAENIANQEVTRQDATLVEQSLVKQTFRVNESIISKKDESSDNEGSRDYTISKFTQGLNHDFDVQIASIDTDPESTRGDQGNEIVGQGGIGIFEPINREIIIKRMKDMNSRDKTAPKQIPLPQKREKIFEQISKRDASVYTNRGRKENQDDNQQDIRSDSQMRESMIKAREQIQQAKRKTCGVLIDYKDTPAKKQHYWLHPGKATQILFKPFVYEYAAVAIFQKQQPLVIRLYGMKDDVNVFLSSSEKYPNEFLCQTSYKNNRRFEFYTKEAHGVRNATFKTQFLYLAVESVTETPIRLRVSFGIEKKKTIVAEEEEEPDDVEIIKAISKHGPTRKKDDVLNTAARNANEHQKRIRLQVEQLVGDRKGAEDFVEGAKETQRKRVIKEREQAQQRNYVAENKQDAGVWRDLEAFTRQELHAQHAVRLQEASNKAQELTVMKRVEAENNLQKRENLKAIKEHVEQIFSQHKEGLIRLKEYTAHVVMRDYVKRAIFFYSARRDYRRAVQAQIMAGLFIFIKIRINLRKQGPCIEQRERNLMRRQLTLYTNNTIDNTKVRAGKLLVRALRASREPFRMKILFLKTYHGWVGIRERMLQYCKAGQAQKKFLLLYLTREKNRIAEVITKTKGLDPSIRKFLTILQSTSDSYFMEQIDKYFEKCKQRFLHEFVAWREETAKLKYYDYQDNRFLWRQPLIYPRIVWSFEEIEYTPDPSTFLQELTEKCTKLVSENFEYYLKPEIKQSPEEVQQIINEQLQQQKKRAYEDLVQLRQIKMLETALNFEGLSPKQVGIVIPSERKAQTSLVINKKQEKAPKSQPEYVEKIKLCHFPDRPQLKYLATGPMLHVLLIQGCKAAFPNMEETLEKASKKR